MEVRHAIKIERQLRLLVLLSGLSCGARTTGALAEIRVAYADDYFYAAGWFYDDDPNGLRVNSLYRDRWNGDDAFWESRPRRTPQGWFAEVRIPFSTLGFQVDDEGRAVMGPTVTRLVSRTGERVTFPAKVAELRREPDGGGVVLLADAVRLRVARTRWDDLEASLGLRD